jgi:hypothetical protein
MNLCTDDESTILGAIRRVPAELQDDAWRYIASRLRPIREPTVFDIKAVSREVVKRYGWSASDSGVPA